jgi:hypothetical protein
MSLDYFCVSMELLPDTDGCINALIFFILFIGFAFLVLGSKKYSHLMEYFEKKFGDWY